MKQTCIVLACALLAGNLPSAVLAASYVLPNPSSESYRQMTALSGLGSWHALSQNIASCAPDRASPVWGRGNGLAGYRCEAPAQGGN